MTRTDEMIEFSINGRAVRVDVDPDTPLLWVIRDEVGLTGTKFGCGIGMCGACTVHVGGRATRSCITPVSDVAGAEITTCDPLVPESVMFCPLQPMVEPVAVVFPAVLAPSRLIALASAAAPGAATEADRLRPAELSVRLAEMLAPANVVPVPASACVSRMAPALFEKLMPFESWKLRVWNVEDAAPALNA